MRMLMDHAINIRFDEEGQVELLRWEEHEANRKARKKVRQEAKDSPTAWFVLLERARRTGDAALEQKALTELKRLGVSVEFTNGAANAK